MISTLSFSNPGKACFKQLGEHAITCVIQHLKSTSDLSKEQVMAKVLKLVKIRYAGVAYFVQFASVFEDLYKNKLQGQISFNLQFSIYQLLQKTWKKASRGPDVWQSFVAKRAKDGIKLLTEYLYNSIFLLSEESA